MPRIYTVSKYIATLAPTAGDGLLVIKAPTDLVLQLISAQVRNLSLDTAEQLDVGVALITAEGSIADAGGGATPVKHDNGDAASSVTVYSADANGLGVEPTTWADPWQRGGDHNIPGFDWEPPYDARPWISPGGLAGIRMYTPGTSFNAWVALTFAEYGG